MERIRVGIVGGGERTDGQNWGMRAHLPALAALPEVQLVAICTRHQETANNAARHFGIEQAFDNPQSMLAHAEIDVVDVCVNAMAHHRLVAMALSAEKHVFCEWPLGVNLTEAQDLLQQAVAAGVKHMVGLQARSAPVYGYMRQLISDGYVGAVLSCSMNGSMGIDPTPYSPTLALIHAGHSLDTLFFVMGEELDEVSSIVSIDAAANHVLINGRMTGGSFVDVNIRHLPVFASGFVFEVNGAEGTLVASIDGDNLPARGVRSLGEQINQATLRGGRRGELIGELPVPGKYRWVPESVPSGPPLSVAQTWRVFIESIVTDTRIEPDFALAVRRHQQFASLLAASE